MAAKILLSLSELLARRKLTQTELAALCGCTPQNLCKIAAGASNPSVSLACKIAAATKSEFTYETGALKFAVRTRRKAGVA